MSDFVFFQGTAAENVEETVLSILKAQLEAGLAASPWAPLFARSKGVLVTTEQSLHEKAVQTNSLKPLVFLSVDENRKSVWRCTVDDVDRIGRENTMTINADLVTSDETLRLEPKLRSAVQQIIDDNKKALREAGFYKANTDPNPQKVMDPNIVNPVQITGIAYTLKPPAGG